MQNAEQTGKPYRVEWRKSHGLYILWSSSNASISAQGYTFDEACTNLCARICVVTGDGEPSIVFKSSPPQELFANKLDPLRIVIVTGRAMARGPGTRVGDRLYLDKQEGLYSKGYCQNCEHALGARALVKACFESLPNDDAAVSLVGEGNPVFSERLTKIVQELQPNSCCFIEVQRLDGRKKRFFELVGCSLASFTSFAALENLVKQCPGTFGCVYHSRCSACGYDDHIYIPGSGWALRRFLSRCDLPNEVPNVFVANTGQQMHLCMKADTWAGISEKMKGLHGEEIGVLRDGQ